MSITTGTSIGSYEVTGRLGAGGMGVVYRARDTKLKRDVAIKCLPDTFAEDPDRIARFQREAEVLASLNHPHIGAIYDLQEVGGACFLILELVEGETLAQRLTRGPIPLDEAIGFSKQIAEALEGAHDKGVIHRDLKPSNIHVTPAGEVKVLDFGLAKVLETPSARLQLSEAPTITSSTPGRVLRGTPAYMSPEQARGQEAGRLSDIWAYGCVLFEMLTGRPAFRGETTSDILGAVLKLEPDWAALPKDTPSGILRLLRRCLQKDKKRRLHDIADARIELEEAATDTPVIPRDRRRSWAPWIAAAIGLLAISAVGIALYVTGAASEAIEQRVEINTPPASRQDLDSIAISPDGTKLAFVAPTDRGRQLWLRSLGAIDAKPLPETEGAQLPFWSPNSQSIGFFAGSYVKRVDIAGGVVQTLSNAPSGGELGGAWNEAGVIVFNAGPGLPLQRVSEFGKDRADVTRLDPPRQVSHSRPQFLPDGRHFLYYVNGNPEARGVYVGSLDSVDGTRLFDADAPAVFMSPDRLLSRQGGTLFVRRFDARSLEVQSDPEPVAQDVGVVTASSTGIVAYRTLAQGQPKVPQLAWFDRSGKMIGSPIGFGGFQLSPELSPDGSRLAFFSHVDANFDVWLVDVLSGRPTRFTSDPAVEGYPAWSPDGGRVLFTSNGRELHYKLASGVGTEQTLWKSKSSEPMWPMDWSRNGFLLFQQGRVAKRDLYALRVSNDAKVESEPMAISVDPNFDERDAKFSPDGRWIAYQSNETRRFEIYVVPFPSLDRKIAVTSTGGTQVRWRSDGRELFYIALDGKLMSVRIAPSADGKTLTIGAATALFPTDVLTLDPGPDNNGQSYVASPDAMRFLLLTGGEGPIAVPITLILNWKPQL